MTAGETGLLVIDVQEKLLPLISGARDLVANAAFLAAAADLLGVPVQATEQYPKGLGGTVAELAAILPPRSDKTAFSCCAVPGLRERFQDAGRRQVLLAGIETHVCVQNTALDLLADGFAVFVAADAVGSRGSRDHDWALRRLEKAGAVVTTAEAAVFEWTARSDAPQFKAISRLVQERMKTMTGPAGT